MENMAAWGICQPATTLLPRLRRALLAVPGGLGERKFPLTHLGIPLRRLRGSRYPCPAARGFAKAIKKLRSSELDAVFAVFCGE